MNEATVCTSPIFANCLGTNTNASPLGSTVQAKAIMYYLVKYILKDKTAIASTLSVIKYALQKQAKYPSRATDKQSEERTGIQLLQIILNKLNGMCEIADTQAAAACLGLPAIEFTSHLTFIFIDGAVAAVNMRVLEDEDKDPQLAWEEYISENEGSSTDEHNEASDEEKTPTDTDLGSKTRKENLEMAQIYSQEMEPPKKKKMGISSNCTSC